MWVTDRPPGGEGGGGGVGRPLIDPPPLAVSSRRARDSTPGPTPPLGQLLNLPLTDYRTALDLQWRLVEARRRDEIPDTLILVEHPPVFTLGRRGQRADVYLSDDELARRGIGLHAT